jgi:hypothetical protein
MRARHRNSTVETAMRARHRNSTVETAMRARHRNAHFKISLFHRAFQFTEYNGGESAHLSTPNTT